EIRRANPGLTLVTVSSFGTSGPYAGYRGEEIVHYAVGGTMSATGLARREPVKLAGSVGAYQAGSAIALAALAGVARAEGGAGGPAVDFAMVESQLISIDRRMTYLLYYAYTGRDAPRSPGSQIGVFPSGVRLAGDGYVWTSTMPQWVPRMLRVLQDPELTARYAEGPSPVDLELAEMADAAITTWGVTRSRQEAMDEAQSEGWAVTAVNAPVDVLADPQFQGRGFFHPVEHPVAGTVTQPGSPMRLADMPALSGAPTLDQHHAEVIELAGRWASSRARNASSAGGTGTGTGTGTGVGTGPSPAPEPPAGGAGLPLKGIRVLDMTVVWAGPYATMLLADLGAEVIRVDNPWVWPASTRGLFPRPPEGLVPALGPIFGGYPDADAGPRPWNRVALFTAHARGKKSVTLALHKETGREAFLRLVERCDVLVENNSVDLMDKLGVGWEAVSARNPRLVMVRLPAVGLEGPYRGYLGFGINFEALCGLIATRGYPDEELSETDAGFHMDAATGMSGALATLAALRQRRLTGTGSLVEVSQCENMLNHIGEMLVEAADSGVVHDRLGNRHPGRAPQGVYRCRDAPAGTAGAGAGGAHGVDRWVAISVGSDEEWTSLVRAMGDPEWARAEDLATAEGRRARHDEIDAGITAWTTGLDHYDAFHRCQAEGVPAGPVLTESECYADPHFRARGLFRTNGSSELGEHEYPAHLFRWDGPDLGWGPIPVMGEHNEEVFRGLVGLSEQEYAALAEDGHFSGDYLGPDGAPL
ncbi:MAG: CaiB/BaiF CoA-transferase family protein, partial [Acidimicrobiales bacterium]